MFCSGSLAALRTAVEIVERVCARMSHTLCDIVEAFLLEFRTLVTVVGMWDSVWNGIPFGSCFGFCSRRPASIVSETFGTRDLESDSQVHGGRTQNISKLVSHPDSSDIHHA